MSDVRATTWVGENLSEKELLAIRTILCKQRDFDIEHYKSRCIRRRIAKRMRACMAADFQSYIQRLAEDNDELDALVATISIHVSKFFRNIDTFQIIERHILPKLFDRARQEKRDAVTLWSAGCATGEEPYSLALLADDIAPKAIDVRVLASDISLATLEAARQGIYDSLHLEGVPEKVRQKYFHHRGNRYHLTDATRSKVTFFQHDISSSAKYPGADLILCRNVLIYFGRSEQDRILERFADVLPCDGTLVLGRSERITDRLGCYFKAAFPSERIYRRTAEPLSLRIET